MVQFNEKYVDDVSDESPSTAPVRGLSPVNATWQSPHTPLTACATLTPTRTSEHNTPHNTTHKRHTNDTQTTHTPESFKFRTFHLFDGRLFIGLTTAVTGPRNQGLILINSRRTNYPILAQGGSDRTSNFKASMCCDWNEYFLILFTSIMWRACLVLVAAVNSSSMAKT